MRNAAISLCLLAFVSIAVFGAFKILREVSSARIVCPVYDEDGGVLPVRVGDESYNSISCYNKSATVVYFGSQSSAVSGNGYEVCSGTSCVKRSVEINTTTGGLYCSAASADEDGGTPVNCLYGW